MDRVVKTLIAYSLTDYNTNQFSLFCYVNLSLCRSFKPAIFCRSLKIALRFLALLKCHSFVMPHFYTNPFKHFVVIHADKPELLTTIAEYLTLPHYIGLGTLWKGSNCSLLKFFDQVNVKGDLYKIKALMITLVPFMPLA